MRERPGDVGIGPDGEMDEALISGDEAAVYADRAYESKARRGRLKAAGSKDRIMHRRHRYLPELPHWQAVRNRLIARRRNILLRSPDALRCLTVPSRPPSRAHQPKHPSPHPSITPFAEESSGDLFFGPYGRFKLVEATNEYSRNNCEQGSRVFG